MDGSFFIEPLHVRRDKLLAEIAHKHGLTVAHITGKSRKAAICHARHEWFFRARQELEMSLPNIGRRTGFRDHSTVIHGIHQHARRQRLAIPRGNVFRQQYIDSLPAPLSEPDWWNDD